MQVGRVSELWRYPVKSMGGQPLDEAFVSWHGVEGDRRWAFVRDGLTRSSFPWLTIRERPELSHFRTWFTEPGRPDDSPTTVRTPEGEELDVADERLAERIGPGVRVIRQNRGIPDIAPLSLITTATIGGLSGLVGTRLDVAPLPSEPVDRARRRRAVPGGGLGGVGPAHRRAADARRPARQALRDDQHRSRHGRA